MKFTTKLNFLVITTITLLGFSQATLATDSFSICGVGKGADIRTYQYDKANNKIRIGTVYNKNYKNKILKAISVHYPDIVLDTNLKEIILELNDLSSFDNSEIKFKKTGSETDDLGEIMPEGFAKKVTLITSSRNSLLSTDTKRYQLGGSIFVFTYRKVYYFGEEASDELEFKVILGKEGLNNLVLVGPYKC